MKLEKLILKNVGCFRGNTEFSLDRDLVLIYGANFSGKSTLARAIFFGLCGKSFTTGMKPKDMVTLNEKSATVGLVFSDSVGKFRVYRSSRGDLQTEELNDSDWLKRGSETSPLPLLNPQQWQIGCFLKEEELGEFIVQTPATRKDLLNKLLGIEKLMQANQAFIKVRRLAKRNEKTLITRQGSLQLNETEDCSEEMEELRNKVAILEETNKGPINGMDKQRLSQELEQQKEIASKRLKSLNDENESLIAGFHGIEEVEATLQQVSDRLSDRERLIKEFEDLKEKRITLSVRVQQIDDLLSSVKGLKREKTCPTCLQPLSPEYVSKLEKEYENQKTAVESELDDTKDREKKSNETLQLIRDLAKRETDLKHRLERLNILQGDINELQRQLETIEIKLSSLSAEPAAFEDHSKLQMDFDQARQRLRKLENQDAVFQQRRIEIEDVNNQAQKASHERLLTEWVTEALEATMQSIIGASMSRIEDHVINCLNEFEVPNVDNSIDVGNSRLMPDVGGRSFHTLSGSEKVILYLAMKISLSQLMPGADFLVLDNPTLHLDGRRSELMRDYLKTLVPAKQIIILTNDRMFADLMTDAKRISL